MRLSPSTAHYQRSPLLWALVQALMRLQVRRAEQLRLWGLR
jgi:hypothetical protein